MDQKYGAQSADKFSLPSPHTLHRDKQSLPTENEMTTTEVNNHKTDTPPMTKKMKQSIKVSVPASCVSTDADGNSLDFNIGRITDVSPKNISIEIFSNSSFEFTSISFIDLDDKEIQIKGKVVNAKRNALGKKRIELSLLGTPKEIADFIAQLVRHYHYAATPVDKIKKAENLQYFIGG